jgi:transcriptional regulator with XRE-family HTH domain
MKNNLRDLRLSKKMTQESVAFELGISQKAYSKIENGHVCLAEKKIPKLCEVFNVTPDYFCNFTCECVLAP